MEELSVEIAVTMTPDGGYGWLVVSAAFLAHVITHGILYSFGVLFIIIQERFGGSKAEVSWILSLATGMLYLIGPVAGYLADRFGIRLVTILGAVIGSIAFLFSMLVSSLYGLYITIGFLMGCGFGMVFLGSIVIVTTYFEKRRALASGIALSGAGSGAFIFSPVMKLLTNTFSWRGTALILSGIVLNCVACGLIFKPVTNYKVTKHMTERKNKVNCEFRYVKGADSASDNYGIIRSPPQIETMEKSQNDNKQREDLMFKEQTESLMTEANIEVNDVTNIRNEVTDSVARTSGQEGQDGPSVLQQLELFRSQVFVIFVISQFMFFVGFYQPFFYIPDKARDTGISEEAAVWAVSTIGISSILGRIVLGYIADRPCVNRLLIFQIALLISGFSTACGPLLVTPWSLFLYAPVYGICTGIILSLTPVVLADLLGVGRLANAFGINNFFCGAASLIGPPLSGLIYDMSGNYNLSFVCAGASMTSAGILMLLTCCSTSKMSK